jgi:hypothetical protein
MWQSLSEKPHKLRANIRPVKIAYFVKQDEPTALANVLQLICTQWGGIRHLIIPIDDSLSIWPLYERLLIFHEPDWFIDYWDWGKQDGLDLHNRLQRHLREIFPHRSIGLQNGIYFEKSDRTAHALHVIADEELKSNQLLNRRVVTEGCDLINLALYGRVYSGQEEFYEETIGLNNDEIELGSENFWLSQFDIDPFSSVVNLTSFGIAAYRVTDGGLSGFDHFDIVLAESVSDICLYWNTRAVREVVHFKGEKERNRRTICLPLRLLDIQESLNLLFRLIKKRLFFPGRTANLDLRFYCASEEIADRAKVVLSKLSILEQFKEDTIRGNTIVFGRRDERVEQAVEDRPLTYIFSRVAVPEAYFEGVPGSTPVLVRLHYGDNEIRVDPPLEFYNRYGGLVSLDIECDVWKRYPRGHRVAKAIKRNCWFSKYGVSMIAGITSRSHFRNLHLPLDREGLRLYFAGRGFEIRSSKIEQYSNAVIDLVGGLDKVGILTSRPAYSLLDVLALKSSKKVAQRIVKSLDLDDTQLGEISGIFQELEIAPELKGIPRTYTQLRDDPRIGLRGEPLLVLLDGLIQAQVLKRGFYVSCPNCGTPNWHPLQSVSEHLTCPGCSFKFVLPARDPDSPRNEMRWRYRLNTLVNRVVDQDALIGILALYRLSRKRATACHSFGLEICKKGEPITDLDFLFVSEQEICAGECKAGTQIGEKDLKTAYLAAELGFAEFYFCTIDQFEDDMLSKIQELKDDLAKDGVQIQINVLSGNELLQENQ